MLAILPATIALVLSTVSAENMVQVSVGREGSFYNPQTVNAAINDTVQFIFAGDFHGVVQASFDKPCTPLPGGFSSSLQGSGSNLTGPVALWNLTITNVSQPIWFYCPASRPESHCAEGMVGAINPGSQDMFSQFKLAAQATRGNATAPVPSVNNNGQGAFATASPAPNPTFPVSFSLASSTISSSSSSPAASQTSSTSTHHTAAVAGGSTAAGVVVVLAAVLLFLYLHRRKRQQHRHLVTTSNPFTYSPPTTGMSEQFPIMRSFEPNTPPSQHQNFFGPRHQNSNLSMSSPHHFPAEVYSASDANQSLRPPPPLQPLRPHISKEALPPSRKNSAFESPESTTIPPSGLNTLAKEVAAVLMQTPTFGSQGKDHPGTGRKPQQ